MCFGPIYFDVHFDLGKYLHKFMIMILYAKFTKLDLIYRPTVIEYSDLVTSRVENRFLQFFPHTILDHLIYNNSLKKGAKV